MIRLTKEDIINEVQVLGLTHCTNTFVNPLINGFANSSTNLFIIFLINYKNYGKAGIQTQGPLFTTGGFQDRCNKSLCHLPNLLTLQLTIYKIIIL